MFLTVTKYSNIGSVAWSKDFLTPELDSAFVTGKEDWDATPTKVGFGYNASSYQVQGRDYSSADGYRGKTLLDPTKPEYVWLNWNYLQSDTTTRRRSTAGHEWGHALGLDHVGGSALMNDVRNRDTIYVPQSDDIKGIQALYP
jgi:hypothetical protein